MQCLAVRCIELVKKNSKITCSRAVGYGYYLENQSICGDNVYDYDSIYR